MYLTITVNELRFDLLYSLLLICLADQQLAERICDAEYQGRCFILKRSPLSWHDAFDACAVDNGRLAEVDNDYVNTLLKAIVAGICLFMLRST